MKEDDERGKLTPEDILPEMPEFKRANEEIVKILKKLDISAFMVLARDAGNTVETSVLLGHNLNIKTIACFRVLLETLVSPRVEDELKLTIRLMAERGEYEVLQKLSRMFTVD